MIKNVYGTLEHIGQNHRSNVEARVDYFIYDSCMASLISLALSAAVSMAGCASVVAVSLRYAHFISKVSVWAALVMHKFTV
jgi:hypothetical protein